MDLPKNGRDLRSQTKNAIDGLTKANKYLARRLRPTKVGTKPLSDRVTRTNRRRWIAERHGFKCPLCLTMVASSRAWVVYDEVQCCKACWTNMLRAMNYPKVERLLGKGIQWLTVCTKSTEPETKEPVDGCQCRYCTIRRVAGEK